MIFRKPRLVRVMSTFRQVRLLTAARFLQFFESTGDGFLLRSRQSGTTRRRPLPGLGDKNFRSSWARLSSFRLRRCAAALRDQSVGATPEILACDAEGVPADRPGKVQRHIWCIWCGHAEGDDRIALAYIVEPNIAPSEAHHAGEFIAVLRDDQCSLAAWQSPRR